MKKSDINISVSLDENRHPSKIEWSATDQAEGQKQTEAKAMLLSLFDKDYKDTFKIDLWTNELQVVEMNIFMVQTLKGLADTYFKATGSNEGASAIRQLSEYIREISGLNDAQN